MDSMDRRRLLTGAVLGSAALVGATSLGATSPEAAFAAQPHLDDGPNPNFLEGRITSVDGTLVNIIDSENVMNRIRVTDATYVWKLRPTSTRAIEVGDGLYARGVPMDDGTLVAESVWLNIVNLHVEILAIGPRVLELDHNGNHLIGHVVSGVTVISDENDAVSTDLSVLRVGDHMQFIGAWRPDTNECDMATIYVNH